MKKDIFLLLFAACSFVSIYLVMTNKHGDIAAVSFVWAGIFLTLFTKK